MLKFKEVKPGQWESYREGEKPTKAKAKPKPKQKEPSVFDEQTEPERPE